MSSNPIVAGIGMATTSLVVLCSVILILLGFLGRLKVPFRKTVVWVLLGVFLSALLRLVWWILEFVYAGLTVPNATAVNAAYVLNRLAWAFSTLTFVLLLAGWMEAVHARYPPPSDRFVTGAKWTLIVVCCFVMLATVIVFILAFTLCATASTGVYAATCAPIYDSHIIIIAGLQAVISLGFLIYGIILLVRIRKSGRSAGSSRNSKQASVMIKIIVVTSSFFVCFGMRAAMLMYRPITGLRLPLGVFYAFAYLVPDFIPPLVQMLVLISTSVTAAHAASARASTSGAGGGTSAKTVAMEEMETTNGLDEPLIHGEAES